MNKKIGKKLDMRQLRSMEDERAVNERCKLKCKKFFPGNCEINTKCRICGSRNTHSFMKAYCDYEYFECEECGSIFMVNIPDTNRMYKKSGDNAPYYIDDKKFEERVKKIATPKVDYVLEVNKNDAISKWIDIGSGGGQVISDVQRRGITAIGIESDESEIEFSRNKGLHVINGFVNPDVGNTEIENLIETADVVSCFCVLEHVEKPTEFIHYIASRMKKNSIIVIEVPRYPSVSMLACMCNPNVVYRYLTLPEHLQIFSDQSIQYIFKDIFQLEATWGFGQGFTDLVNLPALNSKVNFGLYNQVLECQDDVQYIFDKAGLSDRMIYIGRKCV